MLNAMTANSAAASLAADCPNGLLDSSVLCGRDDDCGVSDADLGLAYESGSYGSALSEALDKLREARRFVDELAGRVADLRLELHQCRVERAKYKGLAVDLGREVVALRQRLDGDRQGAPSQGSAR